MIPASHADILSKRAFAHVATIGSDGAPHSTPVWFDWDGEVLRFSQTTSRRKLKNLERDPRLAISILDPDDPYRYLEIRGRVDGIEDDPANAFINSMARKYLGADVNPWAKPGERRVVVRVVPERTTFMG